MEDLRLPQKTLNDYFELLDYQRDFLALKAACEQMQTKLAKIKIATSDPDSTDNIIDDETSSFTTTYSSEKIEDIFGAITSDTVTAKEKIVTAINAKKPACHAKVSDTWDLLSFYISLMGNLQFNLSTVAVNKVRASNYTSNINTKIIDPYNSMSNPYLYKPLTGGPIGTKVESSINPTKHTQYFVHTDSISIFLGNIKIF